VRAMPPLPSAPARVLIIKPSSLGDVVSAVPVLRGLRRSFPRAHIAWLLAQSCAPLLEGDGDLDEIILFDRKGLGRWWRSPKAAGDLWRFRKRLREAGFDWVIDLQGLLRSALFARFTGARVRAGFARPREPAARAFYTHAIHTGAPHTVDRNIELAQALGIDARGEDFVLRPNPAAAARVQQFLGEAGLAGKTFLVLVPPTRWPTKRYPVRHWRSVAAKLAGEAPLVLAGSLADRPLCDEVAGGLGQAVVNLAGRTGVADLAELIRRSAGVVCSDSAALFIAPAVGTAVVALVGPTQPVRTGPYRLGRAIVSSVKCQGCLKRTCSHITCMQLIDPSVVVQAARDMLRRSEP